MILAILKQLFAPLNYLRVRHPAKPYYDYWIPLFLASAAVFAIMLLPFPVNIFGLGGVLSFGSGMLQILTGFYIAALAAVSTFNSASMIRKFDGAPLLLTESVGGRQDDSELNRRRFLSLVFGYLALVSLVTYFFGSLGALLASGAKLIIPISMHQIFRLSFVFVYLFLSASLTTVTLLGLYYLSYRLHIPTTTSRSPP